MLLIIGGGDDDGCDDVDHEVGGDDVDYGDRGDDGGRGDDEWWQFMLSDLNWLPNLSLKQRWGELSTLDLLLLQIVMLHVE